MTDLHQEMIAEILSAINNGDVSARDIDGDCRRVKKMRAGESVKPGTIEKIHSRLGSAREKKSRRRNGNRVKSGQGQHNTSFLSASADYARLLEENKQLRAEIEVLKSIEKTESEPYQIGEKVQGFTITERKEKTARYNATGEKTVGEYRRTYAVKCVNRKIHRCYLAKLDKKYVCQKLDAYMRKHNLVVVAKMVVTASHAIDTDYQ